MLILITGCAGFIGFHLTKRLLKDGFEVVGIDNLNDYYDVSLKKSRLNLLLPCSGFTFKKVNLEDKQEINEIFNHHQPTVVINLGAQAGVRYSLTNPHAYVDSNITGFLNILEESKRVKVKHLIYASTSSVYGMNDKLPFATEQPVDHPISVYAATKRTNELFAHTYSHLFGLPTTGLRFFTVYGPWGRPDMALFLFTKSILNNEPIKIFNYGLMKRDFTYVDDIIESIVRLIPLPPIPNSSRNLQPNQSKAPFQIFNIGNNSPVNLIKFIDAIEEKLGINAKKEFLPLQDGDVPETFADVEDLFSKINFQPKTSIEEGIGKFIDWYKDYYKIV
ncbi:NAD-dependent epimerase [Bacillus sp. T3]|uniref:NAD-dependent epimerase n=1 Tax=Bacillus sp. T3 TaxID=467262 RepID=UPI0029819673|nr:NAD-dependent epimerase [Bacillus sp. T3]